MSITTLLAAAHAPKSIEYISLDIEGHELPVVESFPWDRYDVGVWTVEANLPGIIGVRRILCGRGYWIVPSAFNRTGHKQCLGGRCAQEVADRCPCMDDWFLHASLVPDYVARHGARDIFRC
jgi:hypothetical protein